MKLRYLLPLGIFALMIALFAVGLQLNPREVPSPLIGKPAPVFEVARLDDPEQTFSSTLLQGQPVSLFNVWASWCTSCRQEHPFLMELARRGAVPVYGLNYKDKRHDAMNWLNRGGNPYLAIAFDPEGRVGLDWGVYAVPETFVVDGNGIVRYKHIGPLSPKVWQEKIQPIIEQIRSEQV